MSKWFLPAFVLAEILLLVFKVNYLPYPYGSIVSEALLLLLYIIIELGRIASGERGNLTEKALYVFVSTILSAPACTVLVYLLLWQTYILKVETIIVASAIVLLGIQALLSLVVILGLSRKSPKVAE
jgi:transmembrane protein 216